MNGRRTEKTFPSDWLNVVLEESPGRVPSLLLSGRGRQEEIGAALGEREKRDLAAALAAALHDWRHPRFDNPQLRDDNSGLDVVNRGPAHSLQLGRGRAEHEVRSPGGSPDRIKPE